jgi:hypothetical protein
LKDNTQSFIVRIWIEMEIDGSPKTWRGTIEHVGTANRLYFRDLDGMKRFIQEETGINPSKPLPWWRAIFRRRRERPKGNEPEPGKSLS